MLNPLRTRRFAEEELQRTKTDAIEALGIARFAVQKRALIEGGAKSVGSYHSEPYRLRIKYLCEDLDVLRRRLKGLARDIERQLADHEVGELLTTIDGVGPLAAACLIAELADPARFAALGRSRAMSALRRHGVWRSERYQNQSGVKQSRSQRPSAGSFLGLPSVAYFMAFSFLLTPKFSWLDGPNPGVPGIF